MTARPTVRRSRLLRSTLSLLALGALVGCQDPEDNIAQVEDVSLETASESAADPEMQAALERIANLGYLDGAAPAEGATGVTFHSAEHTSPGLNLYIDTRDARARLMDMEGTVVHEWACTLEEALPDVEIPEELDEKRRRRQEAAGIPESAQSLQKRSWRRVRLLPGGELIAIFEGIGMVKLDRDSRVVWAVDNRAHHDLDIAEDGTIFVLTRQGEHQPRFGEDNPVIIDYVGSYTADGKALDSISIDEAYRNSEFPVTEDLGKPERDIYHTNTLSLLDGKFADRHPAFAKGNILLSFRSTSEIGVLDPQARKMVWVAKGPWRAQHEPSFVGDGRIVLFDNKGGRDGESYSRILEFDPISLEITWLYTGAPVRPLHSAAGSTVMALPNGNLLITEMEQGRVIEVTREGQIAWEFINPNTTIPDQGRRSGILDCVRIEPAFVADWLEPKTTDTLTTQTPA